MKAVQIKKILDDLGYSTEMDIPLKEVAYVFLTSDGMLYPGDDMRFNFHVIGDSGILKISRGYTNADGEFVKQGNLPTTFIDFALIEGFVMSLRQRQITSKEV